LDTLVTIAVIAYNSQKTISDTLNSIVCQTYNKKNIEVIISDDGSKDATVFIAEQWKEKNKELFHSIQITVHPRNRGVSANCDQAWRIANGGWIKTIAADDILIKNCIELNVNYILINKSINILFSNMIPFTELGNENIIKHDKSKFNCECEMQLKNILRECYLLAPTSFIKRDVLVDVGYCELRYPMIEDYPLWYKCLSKGYKMNYMDKATILYRKGDSLSQQGSRIGNIGYLKSLYTFQKEKIWPLLPFRLLFKKWDDYIIYQEKILWIKYIGNRKTIFYKIFHYAIFLIRPYRVSKIFINFFH